MKYIVLMKQESFWEMEVEADSEALALKRAETHARDGERIAKDDEREWGNFEAVEALAAPN